MSRHSTRRGVGIGSSSQVLGADFLISSETVEVVTGLNERSGSPLKGLPTGCDTAGMESSSFLRLWILSKKYSEKISGRFREGNTVGS